MYSDAFFIFRCSIAANCQYYVGIVQGENLMSAFFLPLLSSAVVFALYLALAFVLIRKYKSTGDAGFIWLGVAVLIWPLLSNLLGWAGQMAIGHFASHHAGAHKNSGPLSGSDLAIVFGFLQQVIGLGLLFFAVHLLAEGREKAEQAEATKRSAQSEQPTV
jgi:hypothetical protein